MSLHLSHPLTVAQGTCAGTLLKGTSVMILAVTRCWTHFPQTVSTPLLLLPSFPACLVVFVPSAWSSVAEKRHYWLRSSDRQTFRQLLGCFSSVSHYSFALLQSVLPHVVKSKQKLLSSLECILLPLSAVASSVNTSEPVPSAAVRWFYLFEESYSRCFLKKCKLVFLFFWSVPCNLHLNPLFTFMKESLDCRLW